MSEIDVNDMSESVALQVEEREVIRGISPVVELETVDNGVQITVTDVEGEKQATVLNGVSPHVTFQMVAGRLIMTEEDEGG